MSCITEEMYRVCKQQIRLQHARISILNNKDLIINQIEGKVIDGDVSIDSNSNVRRVCNLKMILDNTVLPNENSLVWTNKKIKLEIGIQDLLDDNKIVWFPMGIFLYKSTQINYSSTEKTLTVNGLDKMANFTGDINGTLESDLKIANMGVPISQAICSLVTQIGGENLNNVLIEDFIDDSTGNTLTLPYSLFKKSGDKLIDALSELSNLYKYRTFFYNTDGVFVAERTKTLLNDMIVADFRDINFTIASQVTNNFDYIKNHVKVIGASIEPLVSVEDVQGTNNENPINNPTSLKVHLNKPLYDQNFNRLTNGQNITSCFTYNGLDSNFSSAVYNDTDWTIRFSITGENGKILKPKPNMLYDYSQYVFDDNGGYIYSSKDGKWSKLLQSTLLIDNINDQIQFKLEFNKPLYNSAGTAIATGTSLKSLFTYSGGVINNFLDAIYTVDSLYTYITFTFANSIENSVIQLNQNSIYDSAGLVYQQESYIMNNATWSKVMDTPLPTYQISYELSNTDDTNPYSINNLGEKRSLIINDEKIYNITQCKLRAEYELQIHSNLNEKIVLSTFPLFFLDVNQLIYIKEDTIGVEGKYKIEKISFGLKTSDTMNLQCSKVYM